MTPVEHHEMNKYLHYGNKEEKEKTMKIYVMK